MMTATTVGIIAAEWLTDAGGKKNALIVG